MNFNGNWKAAVGVASLTAAFFMIHPIGGLIVMGVALVIWQIVETARRENW